MSHYKDANVKDENGCTPLDLASYAGHTDCVDMLLSSDNQADVLVYSHKSRRTALHAAGMYFAIFFDLLTARTFTFGQREQQITILLFLFLAYNGHTDCLKLLLQNAEAEGIVDCLDGQDR